MKRKITSIPEELLTRGVAEIIGRKELEKKLAAGQKLRIKHGVDPTTRHLHLGHGVNYRKLRQFQNLGHTVIFLIGDFTARFGDPTDRAQARGLRSKQEVLDLAEDYLEQAGRIIDMERAEIRYNGEWYDRLSAGDLLNLMAKFTHSQLIERDMFQERIKKNQPVFSHELVYPILQAYDSVMLQSDLTVCGTDQKFNELMARWLQQNSGQSGQAIMTTPMLLGTDGRELMSQSLGNTIQLDDPSEEMYGKIMSIPDELIVPYFELCTDLSTKALVVVRDELKVANPRDIKQRLAKLIIENYYDLAAAEAAEEEFRRVFQERQAPREIRQATVAKAEWAPAELVVAVGLASSKSAARRLVEQGGVRLGGRVVTAERLVIGNGQILQVGKRGFVKLIFNSE